MYHDPIGEKLMHLPFCHIALPTWPFKDSPLISMRWTKLIIKTMKGMLQIHWSIWNELQYNKSSKWTSLFSAIALATFLRIYKYERVNRNSVMLLPLGCPLLIVVLEMLLCHSKLLRCPFKVSWCWEIINKPVALFFPLAPSRTHRTEDQLIGSQWSGGHGKVI